MKPAASPISVWSCKSVSLAFQLLLCIVQVTITAHEVGTVCIVNQYRRNGVAALAFAFFSLCAVKARPDGRPGCGTDCRYRTE